MATAHTHSLTMAPEASLEAVLRACAPGQWYTCYVSDKQHFECAIGASRRIVLEEPKGAFAKLQAFHTESQTPIAGYLGYDLKNDLFPTVSGNDDALQFPVAAFFEPHIWLKAEAGSITLSGNNAARIADFAERLKHCAERPNEVYGSDAKPIHLAPRSSREDYLDGARRLMEHIQLGNIYEVNYCMQFAGKAPDFDPISAFLSLQERSEAPFSVLARVDNHHLLCASPERFLKNVGGELLSQPIKGTARRSSDPFMDAQLKEALRHDPKEQSENVMIVDLVRNDLSRVAARGSVQVEELFGVYSFKTVHHMVSSIRAKLDETLGPWDAIKACFPMGSMTGAPKLSAMKLIDQQENFKRGLYSGAFGKMHPNGDFDFNVVIRSLLYHNEMEALSLSVGSALTSAADPEKEYEECLLKARVLMEVLNPSLADHGVEARL